jgi:ribonuclease R
MDQEQEITINQEQEIIIGKIIINEFGIGFVNTSDKTIYINKQNLNRAYNGEQVQVEIINKEEEKYYGKVINFSLIDKIFVGQVHHIYKDEIFIYSKKLTKSNLIVIKSNKTLNKNDWVKVKVVSDVNNKINGELIKVINNNIDNIIEETFNLSIINNITVINNIPKVVSDIQKIENERKDLTHLYTFTIDPKSCRDCDDAFSIEYINNQIHIYVHISDVAHYINPTIPEFDEIIKRGTTIYGSSRNWTMIPEIYSNYICSILPNKGTYVYTNEFIFLEESNSIEYVDSYYSIIKSSTKFSYEDVYNDGFVFDTLNKSAKIIQSEMKELKLIDDSESHDMVKFWMIKVNQIMSGKIQKIYRCHNKPYDNQFVLLQNYLEYKQLPVSIKRDYLYDLLSNNKNDLLSNNKNDILYFIIKTILPKAYYSSTDNSHYGLGINNYTHWTSPIRRGCDLLNHCILKGYDIDITKYIDCLNESEKLQYQVEKFMVEHSIDFDKIYDGTIISISKTGIVLYVHELDTKYTIHISKLSNERLVFENNILSNKKEVSENTSINEKQIYKLYDILHIKINNNFEFTII